MGKVDNESVEQAAKAYLNENISLREAARRFNVAKSTLEARIKVRSDYLPNVYQSNC